MKTGRSPDLSFTISPSQIYTSGFEENSYSLNEVPNQVGHKLTVAGTVLVLTLIKSHQIPF